MSDKEIAIAKLATGCTELKYANDCFKEAEKAIIRAGLNQKVKYPVGNIIREYELWRTTQSFDTMLKSLYEYINNLKGEKDNEKS